MTREKLIEVIRNALWRCDFAEDEDPAMIEKMKVEWPDDVVSVQKRATAALSALEAAGVRLVPVEATDQMTFAAEDILALNKRGGAVSQTLVSPAAGIWDAMLAASPYAPQKEQTHESD